MMKLYFYIFTDGKMTFSECEAKEFAKSYRLLGDVPGFYDLIVPKKEIGLIESCEWKQVVVLDEKDDALAKKYFSDYFKKLIKKRKKEIEEAENNMKEIEEWFRKNA